MICPMVSFPVTLSEPRFQGHGVIFRPLNALDLLCAQMTRDLFAIATVVLVLFVYRKPNDVQSVKNLTCR